jgi:hypothetical protein
VKVLIIKRPTSMPDGTPLRGYVLGQVYDVSASIAEYLVIEGFALPEMRQRTKSVLKKKPDRRR